MGMSNSYEHPVVVSILPASDLYGPNPYNIDFVFPILPGGLETERVRLAPFIPRTHFKATWEVLSTHRDELFRFYPSMHPTPESFLDYFEHYMRRDRTKYPFAIIDKTRQDDAHPELEGGSLAGIITLIDASAEHLSTEIAFVMIFPAFRRTHVTTNAVGILMKYCLESRLASPPGLGLRRVQWHCNSNNVKSRSLAERMGFKYEGTLRWYRVLPEALATDGHSTLREGDPIPERPGRDTISLSACWDDWEDGIREKVQYQVDRKV